MASPNAEVVLFAEDFSTLPVRVIGGDYSPAGEYHVPPALAATGRWRETFLHYSYRTSVGNWQVVCEGDGAHVLEQTYNPKLGYPLLAAGEPVWREVTVTVGLRPLSESGWRAIVFRYRHARRFYAAAFSEGRVQVLRRINDTDTVLGEAPCALDPDRYAQVKIVCRGPAVRLEVDGREVLNVQDSSPEAFLEGCVAFSATDVTRFRDLRVTAPRDVAQPPSAVHPDVAQPSSAVHLIDHSRGRLCHTQHNDRCTTLRAARAIQPRLWKRIPTPRWGTDRNLRIGDLDGDGRPELVLARRTDRREGDGYYSITSLAAYDLDGRQLWTLGEPDGNHRHTTADLCFQVHDLDGDGKAEVVFCRDFEFCVADGATGKVRRRVLLPRRLPQPGRPPGLYRHFADALLFCDLTGTGRPDSILLKDRYKNVWAYDRDLKEQWTFFGNLGHYPFARDIDGDGKDEVAIGGHLLDHDGRVLWTRDSPEHADNLAIVDLHDSGGNSGPATPRIVVAQSDAGFFILDLAGRERVHYPIGHGQSLCIANVLPERDGLEIVCNTFWGAAGITAVFDEAGRLLDDFEPMPYACLLQPVNWVPLSAGATPADLILLSTHPEQGGLMDGHGRRAVMFPADGHPTLCSDARDLDGDGVDEVLTWDANEIWIYKADIPGRTPANYPRRNPWYNDSNYRAQVSVPTHQTKHA